MHPSSNMVASCVGGSDQPPRSHLREISSAWMLPVWAHPQPAASRVHRGFPGLAASWSPCVV